jgi:hypothetical protein
MSLPGLFFRKAHSLPNAIERRCQVAKNASVALVNFMMVPII